MYASDYPHWDMDLPSTIYDLPFLSETAKRKILGENARKLFNMDVSDRFPNYKPMAAAAE
jgi:predicted TIM-barrel fold metal-dependent hydrolase